MLTPLKSNPLAAIPIFGSPSPSALTLGRVPDETGTLAEFRDPSEKHVLIFGPNGSGKMTRVLAPNLLRLEDRSIFVIDPKGELAAITAKHRRKFGDVIIINPFGVLTDIPGYEHLRSDGFNPMLTLNPTLPSFNAEASRLAEALIKIESEFQPYFDHSARELVATLMMYVAVTCHGKGRIPTLGLVRQYLTETARLPTVMRNIAAMRDNSPPALHGMINKAGQFQELNDPTVSVILTAQQQMSFIDDIEIADDLAAGEKVDFREAKKRPTTVYLILPSHELNRHARWLRVVVASALNALMRPRRKGEPRTLFMMDEFPALGHMEIIETTWALVRGYGIQMMPVFQSLSQLRTIYKELTDTFMGMAGAIAFFPPDNDQMTAEWIMERAGQRKEITWGGNFGRSHGRQNDGTSTGRNWGVERVPRWTAQDLYGMEKYYMLLALAGERDVWQTVAPHYWKVDAYKKVADPNPYVDLV
jgi:type IV secretion system protein VirD4